MYQYRETPDAKYILSITEQIGRRFDPETGLNLYDF